MTRMSILADIIDWRWFAGAFCVGVIAVYLLAPPRQVVYRFPSPDNVGAVTYTGGDGTCYKYGAERLKCAEFPEARIREQPFETR